MFNSMFQSAYAHGKTICVASGDNGSSDGTGKSLNVDFPSSSQYVIACGGTTFNPNGVDSVWNNNNGNATGGGVSAYLSKPSWQGNVVYPSPLPSGINSNNRGLPDISMNGDPNTGYTLAYGGNVYKNAIGGTSCVAPLFSGCLAQLNISQNVNEKLYQNGIQSGHINSSYFNDVTNGNNNTSNVRGAYNSTSGFDLCSGLGTPIGTNFIIM